MPTPAVRTIPNTFLASLDAQTLDNLALAATIVAERLAAGGARGVWFARRDRIEAEVARRGRVLVVAVPGSGVYDAVTPDEYARIVNDPWRVAMMCR